MFLSVAQQPKSGPGHLIVEVSISGTTRHTHIQQDSSERVISSSQGPLPRQYTRDEYPCPERDSNLQSQQSSGRTATGIGYIVFKYCKCQLSHYLLYYILTLLLSSSSSSSSSLLLVLLLQLLLKSISYFCLIIYRLICINSFCLLHLFYFIDSNCLYFICIIYISCIYL